MAQFLRPSSDINTNWSCSTGTARYALIDEVTTDDNDYIYQDSQVVQECKLGAGEVPTVMTGFKLVTRVKSGNTFQQIRVRLLQGSTIILSATVAAKTSFNTEEFFLSEAQAKSITDYTDLRVSIERTNTGTVRITMSQVYLEIPDGAKASQGLEMGCSF